MSGPETYLAGSTAAGGPEFRSAAEALYRVFVARSQWLRDSRMALSMTTSEQSLVLALAGGGPQRMSDLAHTLRLAPQGTTRVADQLERRGLVKRTVDPNNRRVRVLQLTAQARELLRDHFGPTTRRTEQLFLGFDEDQRAAIISFLDRVACGYESDSRVVHGVEPDSVDT